MRNKLTTRVIALLLVVSSCVSLTAVGIVTTINSDEGVVVEEFSSDEDSIEDLLQSDPALQGVGDDSDVSCQCTLFSLIWKEGNVLDINDGIAWLYCDSEPTAESDRANNAYSGDEDGNPSETSDVTYVDSTDSDSAITDDGSVEDNNVSGGEIGSVADSESYTFTDVETTMYATASVNVRSGPSIDYDVIGGYSKGDSVVVTGQCNETGWYRITLGNNKTGYVSSKYVTSTKPTATTASTSSSTTSSSSSSTSSPESSSSNSTTSTASITTYTYTELSQTMYATTSLNIRSGPSTDYSVVSSYKKGATVTITGQCNETSWYRVSYGSDKTGYVSSKYVSSTKPTTTSSSSSSSSSYTQKTGIVETIGTISTAYIKGADQQLALVKSSYISAFKSLGWHFYISAYDVDDTYAGGKYGSLLGLTIPSKKVIYLDNREAAWKTSAIHEFAHFIDCYLGWISLSDEFTAIYKAESRKFCSTFSYKNGAYSQKELFAEAVDMWYNKNSKLKSSCPKIYAFLEKTL